MTLKFGVVSEIGGRDEMQDAYCLYEDFDNNRGWIFGGVYDGHMDDGAAAANFAGSRLPETVERLLNKHGPSRAFVLAYQRVSRQMIWRTSGATALSFLIQGRTIHFANAGDCRMLVIGRGVKQLTSDHNLKNEKERARVLARGARVEGGRVVRGHHHLMPTRTLGDSHMRRAGVIPTPETGTYKIKASDRFLLAACDGLFDDVSNQEIALIARLVDEPKSLANMLFQLVNDRGCHDNTTILVIALSDLNLTPRQRIRIARREAERRRQIEQALTS